MIRPAEGTTPPKGYKAGIKGDSNKGQEDSLLNAGACLLLLLLVLLLVLSCFCSAVTQYQKQLAATMFGGCSS